MEIYLPNSAFLGNIEAFIRKFNPENENILIITSNEKWVSVHPIVLCMVASAGRYIKSRDGEIKFKIMSAKSKHYFDVIGLFKVLNLKSQMAINKHEPSGRFVPISVIKNSEDITKFMTELIPLLHKKDQSHVVAIRHVISELVRNVIEHSGYEQGAFVCAQYHKKSNKIRIGVADCGIGIRTAITKSYAAENDLKAINLALTPGITGTTKKIGGTVENGGLGLFIVKSIAKVNRDFFMIYSGDAMYKLLKTPKGMIPRLNADPSKDKHSDTTGLPRWAGTAVGIDIGLNEHRDFEDLLKLIRDVYRKNFKERGKIKFKRAKFT